MNEFSVVVQIGKSMKVLLFDEFQCFENLVEKGHILFKNMLTCSVLASFVFSPFIFFSGESVIMTGLAFDDVNFGDGLIDVIPSTGGVGFDVVFLAMVTIIILVII